MTGQPQEPGPSGVPRWVKVFGIVVVVLLALFAIAQLTGVAGEHGPSRHLPAGASASGGPVSAGQR
ncbi:hypothetical protein ABZ754_19585 [Micromonospora purpureochromogenes]|uniref:hypothetical protein n=1 Tax=Micromonospora purpureochromogenes TaxID=47872 RepID=UPI0033FA5610